MEFPLLAVLFIVHYIYNIRIFLKIRLFIPYSNLINTILTLKQASDDGGVQNIAILIGNSVLVSIEHGILGVVCRPIYHS